MCSTVVGTLADNLILPNEIGRSYAIRKPPGGELEGEKGRRAERDSENHMAGLQNSCSNWLESYEQKVLRTNECWMILTLQSCHLRYTADGHRGSVCVAWLCTVSVELPILLRWTVPRWNSIGVEETKELPRIQYTHEKTRRAGKRATTLKEVRQIDAAIDWQSLGISENDSQLDTARQQRAYFSRMVLCRHIARDSQCFFQMMSIPWGSFSRPIAID